ncbi:alpha/beta fold hydrolase [Leisingera sp. M523]|uniref:alpha/beta fold hydrolase n=1 Tax=Leisingera sp. M523 TaxID=2867013 RepID=UPI0021A384E6|nr:alpha/beta hydrolase [Leisingera sp. M523]UWQ27648.1 alpha/beta hydrolase [Leisingera sp. M523]
MKPVIETIRRHGRPPFPVAMLHGGPGAAGEMAPVAQELATRGYGVLELLQTEASIAGQISELRQQLETACGGPAVLIGFSWGAWLACLLAARHPARVSKLVLIGSGPFSDEFAAGIQAARQSRLPPAEWQELSALFRGSGLDTPEGLERALELLEKAEAYAPAGLRPAPIAFDRSIFEGVWPEAARMRRSGGLLRAVAKIRCPVTALHGDHDPHPATGVELPLRGVLPDFTFRLLQRCGHKPWIERHARADFFQALEDTLALA